MRTFPEGSQQQRDKGSDNGGARHVRLTFVLSENEIKWRGVPIENDLLRNEIPR